MRSSVFVDPGTSGEDFAILENLGCDRVELYTEDYADAYGTPLQAKVTAEYKDTAHLARAKGLMINAGHDLSLKNLNHLVKEIPIIAEVSIGHALIADALYLGFHETIQRYLNELRA